MYQVSLDYSCSIHWFFVVVLDCCILCWRGSDHEQNLLWQLERSRAINLVKFNIVRMERRRVDHQQLVQLHWGASWASTHYQQLQQENSITTRRLERLYIHCSIIRAILCACALCKLLRWVGVVHNLCIIVHAFYVGMVFVYVFWSRTDPSVLVADYGNRNSSFNKTVSTASVFALWLQVSSITL